MKEHFRNERHKELYRKFEKLRQNYIMVLGGASEEDAENFSFEGYRETLNKKGSQYTKEDSKNLELGLKGMKGRTLYDKLDYDKKPLYCRVLDNIQAHDTLPLTSSEEDPVYNALLGLSERIERIHSEEFKDTEDIDPEGYSVHLMRRQEFVGEIISFFNRRGPGVQEKTNCWGGATNIDELRYNFLLEYLVKADSEDRKSFEREFIESIPMFNHMGFYFWPEK